MKPSYLLLAIIALYGGRTAFAEDVVVRLVNVENGKGLKCYVGLSLGDPMGQPRPAVTPFIETSPDGRVRFSLRQPTPSKVWVDVTTDCVFPCDNVTVLSVDEILRAGITKGMTGATDEKGKQYCRPNYKKLDEIVAKPGEIVIFVRKLSWLEQLSRH